MSTHFMTTLLSINNYHYYRGGAETVFLEHNRMFAAAGWTVVPFAMTHARNLLTPWSRHFVDEVEFGEHYSLAQRLVRVPKVIYSLEARRKLAALIDQTRPDIAHAHNIYHHISPSILGLLKARRVPTVLTLHDLKVACPAYNMLARDGICERCRGGRLHNVLVHRCIKGSTALSAIVMVEAILHSMLGSYRRCVDRFVVPSRFYIDKLTEWGMPRALFTHVPNFVDARRFVPRYAPGREFLFFGRVSPEKGVGTLIRAAALARVPVAVVGTGGALQQARDIAAATGANVTFHGYLTGDALKDAVRAARAVVLPSEWYENAPMSVLEAYALGKPVIGARIGGIPELVREHETGLGFTSGNAESLAEALRAVADAPDAQVEALGRQGRQWVERDFSSDAYQARILEVYRGLGVAAPALAAVPAGV
jgi:glycosyltransferase involved in cell wall biosynthesis